MVLSFTLVAPARPAIVIMSETRCMTDAKPGQAALLTLLRVIEKPEPAAPPATDAGATAMVPLPALPLPPRPWAITALLPAPLAAPTRDPPQAWAHDTRKNE